MMDRVATYVTHRLKTSREMLMTHFQSLLRQIEWIINQAVSLSEMQICIERVVRWVLIHSILLTVCECIRDRMIATETRANNK